LKHKVQCAICGKTAIIEIDDKTREIKSEWGYWGKIKISDGKFVEYWECPECLKSEDSKIEDRNTFQT
jgi:endogenous inhibitor of DNA gyrase (YacG/DUF329 family)